MKKKIIGGLLGITSALCLSFGLAACGGGGGNSQNATQDNDSQIYAVYMQYVAYAESNSQTPLSYEQWLASVKGPQGPQGIQGPQGTQGEKGEDGHTPVITIGTNGNWYVDGVDTGVKAKGENGTNGTNGAQGDNGEDGHTPEITIGANGNWYVDGEDTGKKAQGDKGEDGNTPVITVGDNGNWYVDDEDTGVKAQGEKGEDGNTPEITVGDNGNWYIDGEDTGVKAQGEKGDDGQTPEITVGDNGNWYVDGEDTGVKAQGEKGEDGHTPVITIGANGYWYVDGVSTGVKAQGDKGNKGDKGDDGQTPDITIGYDGYWYIDGMNTGVKAKAVDGHTPEITIGSDGYWYVDGVSTGVKAKGDKGSKGNKGDKGDDGKSAYEIWLGAGHTGSEEDFLEWLRGKDLTACEHEWTLVYILAGQDCLNGGAMLYSCDKCDTLKLYSIDKGSHIFEDSVTAPTCTERGYTTYTCTVCGSSYIDNYVKALGHTIVTDPATEGNCVTYGKTEGSHCSVCNEVIVAQEETALGDHLYVDDVCIYCDHGVTTSTGLDFTLLSDDTYSVSGIGTCEDVNVIIPSRYNDKKVTAIATSAFENNTTIKTITIPSNIKSVGQLAFAGCTKLKTVTFAKNSGVETLKSTVFKDSTAIEEIVLPLNLKTLEDRVFYGCSGLKTIVLPEGLTSIGTYCFSGCSSLTSLEVPSTVTSIGLCALYKCNALVSLKLPFIGTSADVDEGIGQSFGCLFQYAPAVADSDKMFWVDSESKWYLFYMPTTLRSVEITGGNSICDYAFNRFSNLTSIKIHGNTATRIGVQAFAFCTALTELELPDKVTYVDRFAFLNCSSLETLELPGTITGCNGNILSGCTALVNLSLPICHADTTSTDIQDNVFGTLFSEYKAAMSTPNGYVLNYIDRERASADSGDFYYYKIPRTLRSITINGSLPINDYAFSELSFITSVTIGENVPSVGIDSFRNCEFIDTVNWNAINCADYGDYMYHHMFYKCTRITTVNFGENVKHIPANLFRGFEKFTKIVLHEGVETIGDNAFYLADGVTEITLPHSLKSIGVNSLAIRCVGIKVTYCGTEEEWNAVVKGANSMNTTAVMFYTPAD